MTLSVNPIRNGVWIIHIKIRPIEEQQTRRGKRNGELLRDSAMAMAGRFRSNLSFLVRNLVRSDSIVAPASVSAVKIIVTSTITTTNKIRRRAFFWLCYSVLDRHFFFVAESAAHEEHLEWFQLEGGVCSSNHLYDFREPRYRDGMGEAKSQGSIFLIYNFSFKCFFLCYFHLFEFLLILNVHEFCLSRLKGLLNMSLPNQISNSVTQKEIFLLENILVE